MLGTKAYMMGVSPYFYTDLPQYSKNWYSTSDTLWYDRWAQVLDILPTYVELITCKSGFCDSPACMLSNADRLTMTSQGMTMASPPTSTPP